MRRWEDNIRMDLEEMGINTGNLVDLAQDRICWRALVNAPLNLRVPLAMELVKIICQHYNFCFKNRNIPLKISYARKLKSRRVKSDLLFDFVCI